jgi:hypothetical protein
LQKDDDRVKRSTARAMTIATTLVVAGAVAGAGTLTADVSAASPADAASFSAAPATYTTTTVSGVPRVDRTTFVQSARRDAARRAVRRHHARARRRVDIRPVDAGSPRSIGRSMAARRGWTGAQWAALDALWSAESGWRVTAGNGYGAYGIPQALPGAKMAGVGADWRSSASTQIAWGLSYIAGRWGTPEAAWSHFSVCRWY